MEQSEKNNSFLPSNMQPANEVAVYWANLVYHQYATVGSYKDYKPKKKIGCASIIH